ncbi:MAG: GGDEF domain-containing protein, partial [Candidatus Cloacimonetes bacterium]|nr:GGDEF domain-containing protein [Candidatus Cloacimonadota bacterium]
VDSYCYDNILQHIDDKSNELCNDGCPLYASIGDGKKREAEVYLHHKEGYRVPVLIRTIPVKNNKNVVSGVVELFSINKNRISLEEKIIELRNENLKDELTNISNRRHLEEILDNLLKGEIIKKQNIAFCFSDIDDFKDINDNLGHLMGDKVLKMVANTIDNNIRPSDKVFRWGGDEFALILFDIEDDKHLYKVLKRIKLLVNNSYLQVREKKISITMSFGGTIFDENDDKETLFKRADSNMYESKKRGKNVITIS